MKNEKILKLFEGFEQASHEIEGIECWSARELQILLGYSKWENFLKVIEKSKEACENAGSNVTDHFPDVRKTIPMPKGAQKEIDDIALTRYASYLIAQNGDSRKEEITFHQSLPRYHVVEPQINGDSDVYSESCTHKNCIRLFYILVFLRVPIGD